MASLIHRWQLTENANDSVGTLNLTNNGTVTFSSDGASFNGTNQWLSGTMTLPVNFTLNIWGKRNSLDNIHAFIVFCNATRPYGEIALKGNTVGALFGYLSQEGSTLLQMV